MPPADDVAARALAWRHGMHAAICDVQRPWAHGTVVRATQLPNYWDFNVVRVEEDPRMGVDELVAVADAELGGLAHRRLDFDDAALAEPLRADFAAAGWRALRLVWMRHEQPPPPGPDLAVEEVSYDAVQELRAAWHEEDFPGQDTDGGYHAQAKDVALRRNVQVLTVRAAGRPVAFAHIERDGDAAEITQVYVRPDLRGGGRGTAMTRAAILAAGDVRDLWIAADDEDRPKELYARLGFRPARTSMDFTLQPRHDVQPSG